MKWDFAIGNPPYQAEQKKDADSPKNYASPVYNIFMDSANSVAEKVEMIHPARFLFNAGSTPKEWNEARLHDEHFKILYYESEASNVFPNTDIKGGIAISYHDSEKCFTPIVVFTQHEALNRIIAKVNAGSKRFISDIVTNRGSYRYSDCAYSEEPEELQKTSDRRIAPSAFERMPKLFLDACPHDKQNYIRMLGNSKSNERLFKWFKRKYLADVESLNKYKVLISKANGAGIFGEPLSAPIVASPGTGFTETYIAIGVFESETEARALEKYIKTRFARALLGVLKVTQNISKDTWRHVPLQDFTPASDIDWSVSIFNIDKQLYKKYNLSQEEIDFIEKNVKEME